MVWCRLALGPRLTRFFPVANFFRPPILSSVRAPHSRHAGGKTWLLSRKFSCRGRLAGAAGSCFVRPARLSTCERAAAGGFDGRRFLYGSAEGGVMVHRNACIRSVSESFYRLGKPGPQQPGPPRVFGVRQAKEHGFGMVGTFNTSTSTGSIGYYAKTIADAGFIAFCFAQSPEVRVARADRQHADMYIDLPFLGLRLRKDFWSVVHGN